MVAYGRQRQEEAGISWRRAAAFGVAVAAFALMFAALLGANMTKTLSHDEHMYVAGGVLLAREGLLPYAGSQYFQMPGSVFVYGALFKLADDPLMVARAFSTICALLMLALLSIAAWSSLREWPAWLRLGATAVAPLPVLGSSLFQYTSGLAWNHDLGVLCAVLASMLLFRAHSSQAQYGRWVFFSGLAFAFAVATRLSYAPLALPLILGTLWLSPHKGTRRRFAPSGLFIAGTLPVALPLVWLFAPAPGRFLFSNVGYHAANALYWQASGYERAMTVPGKLTYMVDVLREPSNLIPLLLFALPVVFALFAGWRSGALSEMRFRLMLTAGVLVALTAAALGPTPSWYQYFYSMVPFLVLGAIYGLSVLPMKGLAWYAGIAVTAIGCAFAAWNAFGAYSDLPRAWDASRWAPTQARATGLEIAQIVHGGKVLTLAPLFPLEGGLTIYPQLASGPFGWRSAPLMSSAERQAEGVVGAEDLPSLVREERPSAVLTGYEPGLEGALEDYARSNGYHSTPLPGGGLLWVAP